MDGNPVIVLILLRGLSQTGTFRDCKNHPVVLSLEGGGETCSELAKMADDDARCRKLAGLKKGGGVGRKVGFGYLHDRRFAEQFRHGILLLLRLASVVILSPGFPL